jgi:PAS domain S-box-containing protein
MKDENKTKKQLMEEVAQFRQRIAELEAAETECRHKEEELQESGEMYQMLMKTSPEAVTSTDLEGCITFVSQQALDLYGFENADKLLGKSALEFIVPEDRDTAMISLQKTLEEGCDRNRKYTMIRKDKSRFIGEINVSLVKDTQAIPRGFIFTTRDITERRKMEENLRESEQKYRTLTDNVNVGVYRNTVGRRGRFIEANPAIIKMFGYKTKEEFMALDVADLYQNSKDRMKFNEKMLKDGFVKEEELLLKKKDGTPFIGSVSAVAVRDKNGVVTHYDGIIEDITERKRAEMQLKSLFEASRLINSTVDANRTFEFIADSIQRLVGFDYFMIFLVSEDGRETYPVYASEGIRDKMENVVLSYGEGLIGHSIKNREVLLLKDAQKDKRGKYIPGTEFCISQILVPLIIEDQCVGALHISKSVQNAYDQEDVDSLKPLSEVISTAIRNSQLLNEIREFNVELEKRIEERSKRIEIFLNTRQHLQAERNWEKGLRTIVLSMNELGFDRVGVFLVDFIRKKLVFHSGTGADISEKSTSFSLREKEYCGVQCVLEKRTIHAKDAVWVPIVVQDEAFATLTAGNVGENIVTSEDIKDLEILAGMCGAFIDRTRILVEPTAENSLKTEIRHWLDPAEAYLVLEKKPQKSYQIFTDLVIHGIPGFVITRMYPEKLRRKYKLVKTPVLWLSRMEIKDALSPDDLPKLRYIVENFTRKSEESVILLDGLEYLFTQSTFDTVIKHLQELKDTIVLNNSRFIVSLHGKTLSPREFNTLQREFSLIK